MKGTFAENGYPKRAKTKHVVLFVIACVLLAGALFWAFILASMQIAPPRMEGSLEGTAEEYGPVGILGALAAGAVYGLLTLLSMLFFGISWGGGQVISALLAMEKRDKPRWLWMSSRVVAFVNLGLVLALVGIRILF